MIFDENDVIADTDLIKQSECDYHQFELQKIPDLSLQTFMPFSALSTSPKMIAIYSAHGQTHLQAFAAIAFKTYLNADKRTKQIEVLFKVYSEMKQQVEICLVMLKAKEIVFKTLLDIFTEL